MARSIARHTAFVALACALAVRPLATAEAQQMPAAEQAVVVPPRLLHDSGAAYPEQAVHDRVGQPVAVVLVLEVDAHGAVASATVVEPQGHGFDEAAVAAARALVFAPATRDARPVASRIRFQYMFRPPPQPAPEAPLAPAPQAPTASAHDAGAAQEVTVTSARPPREVTRRTLGREEIAHAAGTYGDALLSLQNLPGVARPPPFSGALVVRGSAPQDTNIFIDGTNVPLAFHFGGLSSVVPTELLDRIDFYPGNYGAAYGRGMGGMVDVGLHSPKADGYHFMLDNSILGLRALAEGPIAAGWTFFASGQRSWLDLVLTPILKATGSAQTALPRWDDYQLAIQKDLGHDSSFRLLMFGSDDAFDVVNPMANGSDPTLAGALSYRTSFWRLQARLDAALSARAHLRVTAAYGQDDVDISLGSNLVHVTERPLSGRAELSGRLWPGVTANVGLDVQYVPYDLTLQLPPPPRAGVPAGGPGQLPIQSSSSNALFLPAGYAELELVPWKGARVVPGLRADYDDAIRRWDIAPRIHLRQDLTSAFPRTTLKGGIGVYDQPPSPLDTDARFGQSGLRSNRSVQVDAGLEQEFTRSIDLSVDAFYKRMEDLVVTGAGNAGTGFAYGIEWLLRYKPDAHFYGWLSYTLARSERRDLPSLPSSLFQFDQTHVLTVLGSYKLGGGWQIGGRFRLTSGDLYTPMSTGAFDATVGTTLGVAAVPPFAARMPLFAQLDLRVERTVTRKWLRIHWYLDMQNVTFANNPLGVTYNYNFTKSAFLQGLPILPIAGVEVEALP